MHTESSSAGSVSSSHSMDFHDATSPMEIFGAQSLVTCSLNVLAVIEMSRACVVFGDIVESQCDGRVH
jgi:hypothetical protein